jgi:ABC-type proline/glycine betaine transport system substrate-binding protein
MLTKLELTNKDENWAILEVDNNSRDVDDVVTEWLSSNESKWKAWTVVQ